MQQHVVGGAAFQPGAQGVVAVFSRSYLIAGRLAQAGSIPQVGVYTGTRRLSSSLQRQVAGKHAVIFLCSCGMRRLQSCCVMIRASGRYLPPGRNAAAGEPPARRGQAASPAHAGDGFFPKHPPGSHHQAEVLVFQHNVNSARPGFVPRATVPPQGGYLRPSGELSSSAAPAVRRNGR